MKTENLPDATAQQDAPAQPEPAPQATRQRKARPAAKAAEPT